MRKVKFNRNTLVRWKIYFDRARMYISYVTFLMIVFVFLNSFEKIIIREFLDKYKLIIYPGVVMLFVIFSLILGRIDTKYGMRKEEMRNNTTQNPIIMDMWKTLKKIENIIK